MKILKLYSRPLESGIEWVWLDEEGNEYQLDYLDDAVFNISNKHGPSYLVDMHITVPYRLMS